MTVEDFLALRGLRMPAAEADATWEGRTSLDMCLALHTQCAENACPHTCSGQLPYPAREPNGALIDRWNMCRRAQIAFHAAKARGLLAMSGVPAAYREKTLGDFRATSGTRDALEAAESRRTNRTRGLLFVGPPGTGKTHLAIGVVNARLAAQESAVFVLVPALLDDLRAAQRSDREGQLRALLERTPLLVLDDLGKQRLTPYGAEQLFMLLDARMREARQTIVTTKQDQAQLRDSCGVEHGGAIVSRLCELCEWVRCEGPDYRLGGQLPLGVSSPEPPGV